MSEPSRPPGAPWRFLLIRFSSLGDVVLTLSVVRAIAEAHPDAEIFYLTREAYRPLLEGQPGIARVVTLEEAGARRGSPGRACRAFGAFDAAIDLHATLRSRRCLHAVVAERKVVYRRDPLLRRLWAAGWMRGRMAAEKRHVTDRYLEGSLKTCRKGEGEFRVTTRGRAAHSGGDHSAGRNAIEEMAHQVIAIQKLTDYAKQTTLNVGVIQGGTVSNVVPEECEVEVDVRVMLPSEWERLEAEMAKLKPVLEGTQIKITGGLNRPPMPFDDQMKATFEKAKSIAANIGMTFTAGGTGGASDGNFVAPLGIPLLDGMGAVGEGYHSEREFIFANSIEQKTKLIAELIREW